MSVTANWQSEPVTFATQALLVTFGTGTPQEQMVYSIVLATIAYVTTLLSFGATAVFLVLFAGTFLVGLTRLLWGMVR